MQKINKLHLSPIESYQIRDVIYLIRKVLKKNKGISEISDRLYKPIKKKQRDKMVLKRPPQIWDQKTKNIEDIKKGELSDISLKNQDEQQDQNHQADAISELLKSVETTESSQEQVVEKEQQNQLQIPQTYFQTLAWSLQGLKVFDKMKQIIASQVKVLTQLDSDLNTLEQIKNIVVLSAQKVQQIKEERLRAWEILKIKKQVEKAESIITQYLEIFNYVHQATKMEIQDLKLYIQQKLTLLRSSDLSQYENLNFFNNDKLPEIIEFLMVYEQVYQISEDTYNSMQNSNGPAPILFKIYSELLTLQNNTIKQVGDCDSKYKENSEIEMAYQVLLTMKLQDITNSFILNECQLTTKLQEYIMNSYKQLQTQKQILINHSCQTKQMDQLIIMREKQLVTLINLMNIMNSKGQFRIERLIQLYYVKEVKYFQKYPFNLEYLSYLANAFSSLQSNLIVSKRKFISTINLQVLNIEKHDVQEQLLIPLKYEVIQKPSLNPISADQRHKEYIELLQERNRIVKNCVEKVLKKELLQGECLNLIDIQLEKLRIKSLNQQKAKSIDQIQYKVQLPTTMDCIHQDILGQMIWLLEDLRFNILIKKINEVYDEIQGETKQYIFQNGLPRCWNIGEMIIGVEQLKVKTEALGKALSQYFTDKLINQYLKDRDISQYMKKVKSIDFINYCMRNNLRLLKIHSYYDTFDLQWFHQSYLQTSIPLNLGSLKIFLIESQKYFECIFEKFQKNSDYYLNQIKWQSSLNYNIVSSENSREQYQQLLKQLNHCLLLRFEIGRQVMRKWAKHFFQVNKIIPYDEKNVDKIIDKQLNQHLSSKIKYFPKLKHQLKSQMEYLQNYLNQVLKQNMQIYYQLQIIETDGKQSEEMKQEYEKHYGKISEVYTNSQDIKIEMIKNLMQKTLLFVGIKESVIIFFERELRLNFKATLQQEYQNILKQFSNDIVVIKEEKIIINIEIQVTNDANNHLQITLNTIFPNLTIDVDEYTQSPMIRLEKSKNIFKIQINVNNGQPKMIAVGVNQHCQVLKFSINEQNIEFKNLMENRNNLKYQDMFENQQILIFNTTNMKYTLQKFVNKINEF